MQLKLEDGSGRAAANVAEDFLFTERRRWFGRVLIGGRTFYGNFRGLKN